MEVDRLKRMFGGAPRHFPIHHDDPTGSIVERPTAQAFVSFFGLETCPSESRHDPESPLPFASDWELKVREASGRMADLLVARRAILRLEHQVATLALEINSLKNNQQGTIVPVQSFAPEPYEVIKPFYVVVRQTDDDDEISACFTEANIRTYGSNEHEAVENLKSLTLDVFDNLASKPSKKLGPGPAKQLALLQEFIRKRS